MLRFGQVIEGTRDRGTKGQETKGPQTTDQGLQTTDYGLLNFHFAFMQKGCRGQLMEEGCPLTTQFAGSA